MTRLLLAALVKRKEKNLMRAKTVCIVMSVLLKSNKDTRLKSFLKA